MTLRILMLEDSPEDAQQIIWTLKRDGVKFCSNLVNTKEEFIHGLEEFKPDIVLSDHSLPRFNSQAALTICNDLCLNIPFILVTGAVSEEFAAKILKQGADDYILKTNLSRLSSAILLALKKRKLSIEKAKSDEILRSQKIELEKLTKEMDNFIYCISHDLKAPLNSVLGLVDLIFLEINDQEAVEDYLHKLRSSISKFENYLIEIQSYYSNTRLTAVREHIDIHKLINQCLEKVEFIDGFNTIEKRINIQQKKELFSDSYRLNLIFNNLISNAIKYRDTAKEQSFIEINVTISNQLEIVFYDNGTGIFEKHIDCIFDMHFKSKIDKNSSGIGLYIVKAAIEKLNGTISVDSENGKWTKFIIKIPNI